MSGATKILMGSGAVDVPSDDEFDNVSFLSHFDGANNGTNTVYDDGSASNHTITTAGNPSQGTFGPFARPEGEWSTAFNYSLNALLYYNESADFGMGTGDFTWEAWVNQSYRDASADSVLWQTADYPTEENIAVWINTSGNIVIKYDGTSSTFTTSSTISLNTWTHIAIVRKGTGTNEFSIYIDGTAGVTGTMATNFGADQLIVARSFGTYGEWFTGHISNFRIVKGTAVYTGNFTPPTTPLTAITNTVLLTCQSNRTVDNSASAHTETGGTPIETSAFSPFLTSEVYASGTNGASGYFGGSTDVIYLDGSGSDFTFGTGAFTIEGWVYPVGGYGVGSTSYVLAGGAMLTIYTYQNNTINFVISLSNAAAAYANVISVSATNLRNQWSHFAVTRSGSNLSAFYNGARVGTVSDASGTFLALAGDAPLTNIHVGAYNPDGSSDFDGYISDVRILKGTAVYDPTSSTCTVPTAPLTAITNTKLLLNMADGQVLDSAAQNNMTLTNGAVTSTTQEKFGTASLDLTATDAWVTFPASTNFFGSGNFTIEAWVYVEDVSAYNSIISYGDPIQFYVKSGTLECYAKPLITSGGFVTNFKGPASSISNDTWCHVAMVRNGTEFTAYVNGVGGTTHDSGSTAALTAYTGTASIGAYNSAAGGAQALSFDGYIDDLRVSNFARYTSNFTPSTEAFPDKGQ